jgi:hypothetical protein
LGGSVGIGLGGDYYDHRGSRGVMRSSKWKLPTTLKIIQIIYFLNVGQSSIRYAIANPGQNLNVNSPDVPFAGVTNALGERSKIGKYSNLFCTFQA